MRTFLLLLAANVLHLFSASAQSSDSTPQTLEPVHHYSIEVGWFTTTVLIFNQPIYGCDRGIQELMAAKAPGVENVLQIKAATRSLDSTNLHVYTADGKVFTFSVKYAERPVYTTYLVREPAPVPVSTFQPLLYTNEPVARNVLDTWIQQVKQARPFVRAITRRFSMTFRLQTVHANEQWIFLKFQLKNNSSLSYQTALTRLYVTDERRAKRSSLQELELTPMYQDALPVIAGWGKNEWIVIIPRYTLPQNKKWVVEIQEAQGGRPLQLAIRNKHLLQAHHF